MYLPADSRFTTGLLAILGVLLLSVVAGCQSGDDGGDEVMNSGGTTTVTLHHDGDQFSSPQLVPATYEAAARFTAADLNGLQDGDLTRVRFYINSIPTTCMVKVYGDSGGDMPGALLYSADVTASLKANDWNSHTLANPVPIPNGDLWIAIEFTHPGFLQTIGCDAGPTETNGDWLYSSADGNWTPFGTRLAISINWNIRGIVTIPE